eukprot:2034050-Pleurochrysis_carterae.AAC.1
MQQVDVVAVPAQPVPDQRLRRRRVARLLLNHNRIRTISGPRSREPWRRAEPGVCAHGAQHIAQPEVDSAGSHAVAAARVMQDSEIARLMQAWRDSVARSAVAWLARCFGRGVVSMLLNTMLNTRVHKVAFIFICGVERGHIWRASTLAYARRSRRRMANAHGAGRCQHMICDFCRGCVPASVRERATRASPPDQGRCSGCMSRVPLLSGVHVQACGRDG